MLKTMIQRTTLTRALVASLALLAPVSAANPAVTDAEFEQTFAPFDTEAPAPQVEGDVVDLAEIEPAVEAEPATTSLGSGVASYYGRKFHGRRTANGERFNPLHLPPYRSPQSTSRETRPPSLRHTNRSTGSCGTPDTSSPAQTQAQCHAIPTNGSIRVP